MAMRRASTTQPEGQGLSSEELDKIEAALGTAFDIRFVFNQWTLGESSARDVLGIPTRS